jgi:hypothetical protein
VTAASEEVTKTWIRRKGALMATKPRPSRFSFAVCLTVVLALTFGFISGFVAAGFALEHNFSSVYESLLLELEIARTCFEREQAEAGKNNNKAYLIKN